MATLEELVEQAYPKKTVQEGAMLPIPEDVRRFPRRTPEQFTASWPAYVNPEQNTPGIVGETVGKLPRTPFEAPTTPSVPRPTMQQTPQAAGGLADLPQGIPTGAKNTGGTTEESGKFPTLDEITRTEYPDSGGLTEADTALKTAAKHYQTVVNEIGKDEESVKAYKDYLARKVSVEDLLDPNSTGFQNFVNEIKDTATKMQSARKDLEDYQKNYKVDPQRYWKETPLLDHVFNSISMLMEGQVTAAATRAGLSMPMGLVQQRIDKAIQDDVARQREEFKSGEASKENTINRFRDNMKLLNDDRAATLKTQIDFMTMAKDRYESLLNRPELKAKLESARLDEGIARLDHDIAKRKAEMSKILRQSKDVLPKGISMDDQLKMNELKINVLGVPFQAKSTEAAKYMRDRSSAAEQAVTTVRAMKKVREDMDLGYVPVVGGLSKLKQLGDELKSILQLQLKQNYNLGTLDEGSIDFMDKMIPGTETWGQVSAKLDALERGFISGYTADLNQRVLDAQFDPQGVADRFNKYDEERGLTRYLLAGSKK